MSDIKAKVHDKQTGTVILECQHDKYNRLCAPCAVEAEKILNNLINSTIEVAK